MPVSILVTYRYNETLRHRRYHKVLFKLFILRVPVPFKITHRKNDSISQARVWS